MSGGKLYGYSLPEHDDLKGAREYMWFGDAQQTEWMKWGSKEDEFQN